VYVCVSARYINRLMSLPYIQALYEFNNQIGTYCDKDFMIFRFVTARKHLRTGDSLSSGAFARLLVVGE
jgi:hypothetical protein